MVLHTQIHVGLRLLAIRTMYTRIDEGLIAIVTRFNSSSNRGSWKNEKTGFVYQNWDVLMTGRYRTIGD